MRKLGGSVSCRRHHHINYQKRQVISHNSLVVDYLLIPTSVQYQDYNFVTWTSLISLKLEQISALHKIKAYDKRRENQERRIWCVRRFEVDIKKMGFSRVNIFVDSQRHQACLQRALSSPKFWSDRGVTTSEAPQRRSYGNGTAGGAVG